MHICQKWLGIFGVSSCYCLFLIFQKAFSTGCLALYRFLSIYIGFFIKFSTWDNRFFCCLFCFTNKWFNSLNETLAYLLKKVPCLCLWLLIALVAGMRRLNCNFIIEVNTVARTRIGRSRTVTIERLSHLGDL